ncbi:MAG: ATPase domain-containing protein [Thermodesulfobacteriota bacterium]|nr:ATPase domain-containing protein [Thermodesulfobacteriota bacterium]
MSDFSTVSPLKILDHSVQRGLGAGNLGVLVARAGVGKTACLIQIALDKILRNEKLVHVSLEEGPEKVISYYRVLLGEQTKSLNRADESEAHALVEANRMILAFMNQSFDIKRLLANLKNLRESLQFQARSLIIDGLDFKSGGKPLFQGLKEIAAEFQLEVWLSALSHRHINDVNERGVPYPCHEFEEFFSIIIQLQPQAEGVFLRLLKDHDSTEISKTLIRLDPNTFLVSEKT